jgi:ligand-binding sensor domain-containing protein/signal transduction histidine kinase
MLALDPRRAMSRYLHDRWGTEQGYPGGPVYALAQTPDGYLWIGTQEGLVRFDGFSFSFASKLDAELTSLLSERVLGLLTDTAGNMWIRLRGPNLLHYRDGEFRDLQPDFPRPEAGVTAMGVGSSGGVLLATFSNGIITTRDQGFEQLASTAGLPNFLVLSIAQTPDGTVWIGTRDSGLFSLRDGRIAPVGAGQLDRKINCLLAAGDGGLWIGSDTGVVRWNGERFTRIGVPGSLDRVQVLAMTRDRESNVWIATAAGLLRFNDRGVSPLDESNHGRSEAVTAVFEDREGNLWIGSAGGVERLRDSSFVTYSASDGLPSDNNGPIFVDRDGRAWFAAAGGGLYWLNEGQLGQVAAAGLGSDVVYSIAGGNGELWVGRQTGGLTRLRSTAGGFAAETYTQSGGLAQQSVYSVHLARDGAVWAGTLSGGVSRLSNGRFTTYTIANGLASNTVVSILEASDGTMWFATPNGLSALSAGRWHAYAVRDGLPSANINCLLEDSTGVLWIGTVNGLALLDSSQIRAPPAIPQPLKEQILGLAEDNSGSLWVATANHVLRVNRDRLMLGELRDGDLREYGMEDGLRGTAGVKRHRSVVADSTGQVWFSMNRGLSVVDPQRLTNTAAPAIVHIQTISADGRAVDLRDPVRIPPGLQRLTLGFAGLSLAVPERVRFRYRLDGFDHDWNEPAAGREAAYTNLSPGPYRFRVIASNADGIWNSAEGAVAFEVEPLFWQAWWFRLGGLAACVLGIVAFHRFRLHQLTRHIHVRFEERLAERTRIAQELHDTLLQGFLSASMQLHVAVDRVPEDLPAKSTLNHVLQLMGRVIDEGRNAVRGLRSSQSDSLDLEQAFSRIEQELAIQGDINFRVVAEGRPQALHPVLRDEVYRIGREAVINAFRHSQAKNIEVELEYAPRRFRLLVRDNGCGIDPRVLESGREGHWGLPGMRERAERIGGQLSVWSRASSGTEVELSVPSQLAFQGQSQDRRPSNWFFRLYPRRVESKGVEVKTREK